VLEVTFKVLTAIDMQGLERYCFITDTGLQAPTLHVNPGDKLILHLQNQLPAGANNMTGMPMADPVNKDSTACTPGGIMGRSSTNVHFHGLNAPPLCHQDEVIHTLIQPSQSFDYQLQIPPDEPPGLYWYHPHPHGFSANQVRGGATGALIVEGMEGLLPSLAGLPQRTFVLRDQLRATHGGLALTAPSGDISINFVPVVYPAYLPAIVQTNQSRKEFWRVLNSASFTTFNLQYLIGNVAQQLELVAIDGVPVGGVANPRPLTQTSIVLPPGARVEFVLTTPNLGEQAQLVTETVDSGPDGISNPARPIANIVSQAARAQSRYAGPLARARVQKSSRFAGLRNAAPNTERLLYFSENLQPPPGSPPQFFVTVDGQTPKVFDMNQPPNIVVQRGAVEYWTVENRSNEDHVFHIHQLHFQVIEIDGQPVDDPAIRDTIRVPYWSGSGPYPSVKLSMDFRDPNISGTFVYHCHILDHEDLGMMGEIQVVATPIETATTLAAPSTNVNVNAKVSVTATLTSAPFSGAPISGSVQFAVDGVNSGSPIAVANGQAVLTTAFASGGKHTVTASYSGDANYQASKSGPLALSADGFVLTADSATTSGKIATAGITVAPAGEFHSAVFLSCSVPAELSAGTCSVNPASLASGSGRATLVVNAIAFPDSKRHLRSGGTGTAIAAMLAGLLAIVIPSRKRNLSIRLCLLLAACLVMSVACTGNPWNESGTYNVSVKATSTSNGVPIEKTLEVLCKFH
jgi:FtsP/CotA-like multicopper oxidase with cupredoxin domain